MLSIVAICKTCVDIVNFVLKAKYTGREKSKELQEVMGLTHMDKTLCVKGARIAYTIWEVDGN